MNGMIKRCWSDKCLGVHHTGMGVINTHGDLTPTEQYEWNCSAIRIRHLKLVITTTFLINQAIATFLIILPSTRSMYLHKYIETKCIHLHINTRTHHNDNTSLMIFVSIFSNHLTVTSPTWVFTRNTCVYTLSDQNLIKN